MRWFESSHPRFICVIAPALRNLLDAFTARDLRRAVECFEGEATYQEARSAPVVGRDAIAAHFAAFASSGADWHFAVDDVRADGDAVRVSYRFMMAKGEGEARRERAGVALVQMSVHGLIAEWREYES